MKKCLKKVYVYYKSAMSFLLDDICIYIMNYCADKLASSDMQLQNNRLE